MMKIFLIVIFLFTTCVQATSITIKSSKHYVGVGESVELTFLSDEPVIENSFTKADVLVYSRNAGEISGFTKVNASTWKALFTSNQSEEIAILIDDGAYKTATGLNSKTQFGLNYRGCYKDSAGLMRYDSNRLVFPKFGEVVKGGGVVNYVPCYRKTFFAGRRVYKYEPAPFKPILLSDGQYLALDSTKSDAHQHSDNSVHHSGSFINTWDMTMMRFKGGAVGSSAERIRYVNHDSYDARGDFNSGGHLQMNGASRVGIGLMVEDGLRHQDNIVSRGLRVSGHLHQIYGNAGANYLMTPLQIQNSGVSAARGGTVNRTLYWQPALIRMGTGEPVMNGRMEAYYKMIGDFATETEWFPDGLVIIAGFPPDTPHPQDTQIVAWKCSDGGQGSEPNDRYYIPRCTYAPNAKLVQRVAFPTCWDGVHLDSADHMRHMAYMEDYFTPSGRGSSRCPASHPVKLPGITQNIHIPLMPGDDTATWTLSSDNYALTDRQRGKTSHADWIHGWKRDIALQWLEDCQNKPIDCGGNYIGRTPPIAVSSISYNGTTATAITPKPHGLRTGLNVQILGAKERIYNGDTNVELPVSNVTCSGPGKVEVKHQSLKGGEFRGLATYFTPFTLVGANEQEFNGTHRSHGYGGKTNFTFLLKSQRCPARRATGKMKVLVDNGVPKQTVKVVDEYTFTYQLPEVPSTNATGSLFFRVGRALF